MIQSVLSTRVIYLDEHPICHSGLDALFSLDLKYQLSCSATRLIEAITSEAVELAIVEIGALMPKGVSALREIKSALPKVPILVLSCYDEEIYAERCLKAGASGYVMKSEPLSELRRAIDRVVCGDLHVSEHVKSLMIQRLANASGNQGNSGFNLLSDRELLIVEQIGLSKNNKEIAQTLQISVKTIESHRSRIKTKLRLDSPQDLVRYAMRTHPA